MVVLSVPAKRAAVSEEAAKGTADEQGIPQEPEGGALEAVVLAASVASLVEQVVMKKKKLGRTEAGWEAVARTVGTREVGAQGVVAEVEMAKATEVVKVKLMAVATASPVEAETETLTEEETAAVAELQEGPADAVAVHWAMVASQEVEASQEAPMGATVGG